MSDVKKKQLVYNFIDFIRTSAKDGTVKEDDAEGLEVAVQVLSEAFGVDPDSEDDKKQYSIAPTNLVSLLDVYLNARAKQTSSAPAAASASTAGASSSSTEKSTPAVPSADDKKKADEHKLKGNQLMGQKLYDSAIEEYNAAIKLHPDPVYYSNRAAAWGSLGKHDKAAEDAESAISIDPKFAKGFSRLGHARLSLDDIPGAIEAYENGLKLDPSNAAMKAGLASAKGRSSQSAAASREARPAAGAGAGGMPDLSSLASMMGGLGGGAGGGMPDLAEMMRNPQMMAMAQQMMSNGGLERLMSNPRMREMAESVQNGGAMPDLSQLASDPSMRDLAQQFMGNGAGAGAGAGRQ